jgi:phytoene dehydrogenase-like protein
MSAEAFDAVVIGSGPNGLAAGITLAEAGRRVLIVEGADRVGGGARSGHLTGDESIHDVCSAVHPLALASPVFRRWSLDRYGLQWVFAPVEVAHPFDDGTAVALYRDVNETAAGLGRDEAAYCSLISPLVSVGKQLLEGILDPFPPKHPLALIRLAAPGIGSVVGLARRRFIEHRAPALLGGMAAHSFMALERRGTAGVALVFATGAHSFGWPMARCGSQAIVDALAAYFCELGGEIRLGHWVRQLADVPAHRVLLMDVAPTQVATILADQLPTRHRRRFTHFNYGPGLFKLDYLLDGPIPWKAPECSYAATVHLGGTLPEIAAGESAVNAGHHPTKPFVLLAQQSRFDPSRCRGGDETVWTYCHVPNGSAVSMAQAIENQIERFAPGFKDRIIKTVCTTAEEEGARNPTMPGGVIDGGFHDPLRYVLGLAAGLGPYRLPRPRTYLCSSFTPPGPGVHGMCGNLAARRALRADLS